MTGPLLVAGERALGLQQRRPVGPARQLGVQRDEMALVLGQVVLRVDRADGTKRDAHRAINALVGIDGEEVGPFVEARHRADFDAIGMAALDAGIRHDKGHGAGAVRR
ncbi:hypothetical protein D3C72_2065260 [compost metagenome]